MAFEPKIHEPQVNTLQKTPQPFFAANAMPIQTKLTVNEPGDAYEQEADAVADKVIRMPDPSVQQAQSPFNKVSISSLQRKCATCDEDEKIQRKEDSEEEQPVQLKPIKEFAIQRQCADCEKDDEKIHRKETGNTGGGMSAPPIVSDVISSGGASLDKGTQQFMESRMGHDFSNVQVHTDSKAAESAQSINALAYTSGNHVVFNSGQYQPNTEGGRRLLAHELVHVGQQSNMKAIQRKKSEPDELLKGLREQVSKDQKKKIEQLELNNREIEKEKNLPTKDKKQLEHKIREKINIKEKIAVKTKEVEHLNKKVKKTRKRGEKVDKMNSKLLSNWFDKKELRQIHSINKLDFELLKVKLEFNLLNDEIKEVKGYIDGGIANYKEDGLTIPNIEDNYVFSNEEIATISDKGFTIPDGAKKYIRSSKTTKDDETKEFDAKDAALTLVKLYLGEGEFKDMTPKSLSADDKLLILKYYQVEDGKEYDLYLLRNFIKRYLNNKKEIEHIFGDEPKQIAQDTYIKMLATGVNSINTKKPKDQRMKDLSNQIHKNDYKELLESSAGFINTLNQIKYDTLNKKGESNEKIFSDGKELSNIPQIKITEDSIKKKNESELLAAMGSKQPEALPTARGIFKNFEQPLFEDAKEILEKHFHSNEKITGFSQVKALPFWENNKDKIILNASMVGGILIIPLVYEYSPQIKKVIMDEADKIKNDDLGSIGSVMKYLPEQCKSYSLGKNYHIGDKEYEKTNAKTNLKFYQKDPLLNEAITDKMITGDKKASDLRKEYITYISPKAEFSIEDAVKKSNNPWFKQNWSVYLDNRIYLRSKAGLGPIQSLDQAIENGKNFDFGDIKKSLKKVFDPTVPDKKEDKPKSIYDFQLGTQYTLNLGNQKVTASGDYLSLNSFNLDEDSLQRVAFNLEYENKLMMGAHDNLIINSKVGATNQDINNNYNLQNEAINFNLGLMYNFGDPKSGSTYASGDFNFVNSVDKKELSSTYSIKTGATYELNPKHALNNFFQCELKIESVINSEGIEAVNAFFLLRPRARKYNQSKKNFEAH